MADYRLFGSDGHFVNCEGPWWCTCDEVRDHLKRNRNTRRTTTFQLRRTKGWRKPEGGVVVARPSKWGNPFPVGIGCPPVEAVELFEQWLATGEIPPPWLFTAESVENRRQFILDHVHELAGKKLGCWCDQTGPCHAKVLARMADEAVARG